LRQTIGCCTDRLLYRYLLTQKFPKILQRKFIWDLLDG